MADQEIISLGTPTIPLTVAPIAGEDYPVGSPVCINTTSGEANKAFADNTVARFCMGLAKTQGITGERSIVQYGSVLKLSTTDWDVVTGGSGGLAFGREYYVNPAGGIPGKLTTTRPTTSSQSIVPVGVAISTTEMMILLTAAAVIP